MNSENSNDLTEDFKERIDNANILNMAFTNAGNQRDLIGFGVSSLGGLMYAKLGEFPIKGIICSSNFDHNNEDKFIEANCFTTVRGYNNKKSLLNNYLNNNNQ